MSSFDAVKKLGVLREDGIYARGSCATGKMTLTKIPRTSERKQTDLLSIVYSDVYSQFQIESKNRSRYFVMFIDSPSRLITAHTISAM